MNATLDAVSGAEKLKLVRELGTIRRHLPGVAGVNKLTLVKRMREIRQLLSVDVGDLPVLSVDPGNIEATYQGFIDYFGGGISGVPEAIRSFDKSALIDAANLLYSQSSPDDENTKRLRAAVKMSAINIDDSSPIDAFEHFKAAGDVFSFDSEIVTYVTNEIKTLSAANPTNDHDTAREIQLLQDQYDSVAQEMGESWNTGFDEETGFPKEFYRKLEEKRNSLFNQIRELGLKKYTDKDSKIKELTEKITPTGQGFIDTLTNISKVTQEKADSWAAAQTITKSAKTRLGKLGYKEADIRRDMAEFYRITGGKLRHIVLDSNGKKRAHATGIGHFEDTVIYPGSRFNKTVLWHEMAHHLEVDPSAKAAANGFLLKRRESEKKYRLRDLTGNKGYGTREIAYKDDFINPYVGKVYDDEVTEVWSMGIQYLSNPKDAALMLGKDPEMAALIAGYLQSDLTPGMKALQAVHDLKKDDAQTKRDDEKAQYEDAIKKLADGVQIVDDGWWASLSDSDMDLLEYISDSDDPPVFEGSLNSLRVFSGKFKNYETRRVGNGYAIIESEVASLHSGRGSRSIPPRVVMHGISDDELKAAIRIIDGDSGIRISNAKYELFNRGSLRMDRIIYYAKKILGAEA